jgi:hypothetical protein
MTVAPPRPETQKPKPKPAPATSRGTYLFAVAYSDTSRKMKVRRKWPGSQQHH